MKPRTGTVLCGLMLATALASLNQSMLAPAIPTLVGELGGVSLMLWVLSAYFLCSTISMPIYGKIGDLIGRKPLLIAAISIFMLGSVVGALAQDMLTLIIGRAIQGLGGGGLIILSQAAMADVVPARQRGKYMGLLSAVFAVASVVGPLAGGWLVEGPGWRWTLWLALPIGLVALIACARFLPAAPSSTQPRSRLDWWGMFLLATGTGFLVLLVTWAGVTFPWVHPVTFGLLVGALVAFVCFGLVQRRTAQPTIPPELFRKRNFNLATAGALLVAIAMFAVMGYLPTYLQMVHGTSATVSGLLMVPMMVMLVLTSTMVGSLISRYGNYKWYPVVGTMVIAVSMVLLSTLDPEHPVWLAALYLALLGFGLGNTMQIFVIIVQGAFADRMVGTATASNNYFRQLGATIGTAVVGSLFASRLTAILAERLSIGQLARLGNAESLTPETLAGFPARLRQTVETAYSDALTPIFLWIAPLLVLACILLMFLSNNPLAVQRDVDRQAAVLEAAVERKDAGSATGMAGPTVSRGVRVSKM